MVRMKTVRPGTKKAMEHEPFHPSPIFSGVIIDCLPASTRDAPKGSAATGDLTGIRRSEYRLSAMRSARSGKSSVFSLNGGVVQLEFFRRAEVGIAADEHQSIRIGVQFRNARSSSIESRCRFMPQKVISFRSSSTRISRSMARYFSMLVLLRAVELITTIWSGNSLAALTSSIQPSTRPVSLPCRQGHLPHEGNGPCTHRVRGIAFLQKPLLFPVPQVVNQGKANLALAHSSLASST